ncbi:MAG TPA: hypothetical protein DHW80_02770 [Acinetobacter sp.]|uniref:hypothetical protein n=1 Tax=Acinetobacter variabilis TaxID=70346 RepID=UPI000EE04E0C|nr:hypothetical protein [Acinetobacter variabilis]HCL58715.1 hypothetical protein [Acinetobacter sp.]
MNIKFVVVGLLVIAGLFFGTEKYWEHEFQQQARDNLKQVHMDAQTKQRLENSGLPISGDILNQYPNIITYMKLTTLADDQLSTEIQKHVQQLGCMQVDQLQGQEPDLVKAYIVVLEEDQVASTYTIQNKFGKPVFEYKQVLSECPNFTKLRQL